MNKDISTSHPGYNPFRRTWDKNERSRWVPHQGKREAERRAKRLAKQEAKK